MSLKNLETAFRGSSEDAAATLDDVQLLMKGFTAKGGAKQLHFSHNVLTQMCQAVVAGGTNYSLYCDVLLKVLAPNVEPTRSPKYWSAFLEMLRYFYFLLFEKKLYTDMTRVYDWLASKPHKLQNEGDYEFILGIYTQQLISQIVLNTCPAYSKSLENTCTHLATLFEEMLQKNKELNFVYKDLLKNIMRFLIPKKAHNYVACAPNSYQMFDALFRLMSGLRAPQIGIEETKSLFMDYMAALMQFTSIDAVILGTDEQVALRFLRVTRDLTVFKSDKAMTYALSLLYYFVKFVFAQDAVDSFSKSYAELCENFRKFFARNGETLKSEQWFMEFIMAMTMLLSKQDVGKSKIFGASLKLKQNVGIDVNNAHLLLILDLIKLAPSITQTKLMNWTCCTSTRKHTILCLARAALKLYTFYVAAADQEDTSTSDDEEINKTITMIMRHSVQVIDSMICINSSSSDLQSFYTTFNYLLTKVQTSTQVKLCITLTETFLKLQKKFTPQMWMQLLLRLRRATPVTKDCQIIAEMHAIQIGYMLKLKHLDYSMLLNEIGIFYTTEHLLVWDMCLLEVLEMSKSSLKPILDAQEMRLLHTLESQIVYKYQKANLLLLASLLKCSQTHLDFVLVSRESKQLETHGKVQRIYKTLKRKAIESSGLKRVEKLTMAHACTILASEQIEKMKKIFDYQPQKDFAEETLERYLLSEKIKRIDVLTEINLIEIVLEAVQLFGDFFETADLEPITSQELLLDWEAILADISFLARLLQVRGYLEHACKAWLLLYNIANFLDDSNNILRALAFLCEHAAFVEQCSDINLTEEVNQKLQIILNSLPNIQTLVPRRQNYLLLSLCQLAYYYARLGNYNYAYILLNLVDIKHNELPERREKFDFILGSLQAVKFRILWKFMDSNESASTDSTCILRQIEATFNSFRGFVYITSEDSLNYMILLFGLMQEFSECTVNRLCDSNVKSFFISILKAALDTGSALRVVQSLTSWAMANLQMEHVDKAQTKLQIIECFLGVKNVQELIKKKSASCAAHAKSEETQNIERHKEQQVSLLVNPGVEIMRRVAQVHLSPILKDKLTLASDTNEQRDLQRFFKHDVNEALTKNNFLQWTFIAIGCVNARLLFLIEDYTQLEQFYRNCKDWFHNQKNNFLLTNFQNVQVMSMQHYLNYLRADKKYDKALECVEEALSVFEKSARNVDKVYNVNLELQKRATKYQMLHTDNTAESLGNLRRVLEFGNLSPEEDKRVDGSQRGIKKISNRAKPKNVIENNENAESPTLAEVEHIAKRGSKQVAIKKTKGLKAKENFVAHKHAFIGNKSEYCGVTSSTDPRKQKNIGADVIKSKNNFCKCLKPLPIINTLQKNASKLKENISSDRVNVDLTESDEELSSTFSTPEITVIEAKCRGSSRSTTPDYVQKVDEKPANTIVKPQKSTKNERCLISSANLPKSKDPNKNQQQDALPIQPIESVNLVDSENEENIAPASKTEPANAESIKSSKLDINQITRNTKQCRILSPTVSSIITSDIVNKMKSLELTSSTPPGALNTRIIENTLEKKITTIRALKTAPAKGVNRETSKPTEILVKKRGRPKKTETEAIKENKVIDTIKITRRRQQT